MRGKGTLHPHSNQETSFPFSEKHHHLVAWHSHRNKEEGAAPLEMTFITAEIPQQLGQTEKVRDHVTVLERACEQSRKLHTH